MAFIVNANFFRMGYLQRWPSTWYKKSFIEIIYKGFYYL